jgi:CBS domain-containing protein
MYCKDIMIDRKEVISVASDFTLANAINRMDLYGHRTLPVINMGRYLGVIDKYTIHEHIFVMRDVDLHTALVKDYMRTDIQHVFARDFIEKAAVAFFDQRYQFVPVIMDDTRDQFLGIIPITTIMDIFASAMGLGTPAHRITLEVDDYVGELAKLTRAFVQADSNIISFVTVQSTDAKTPQGDPKVMIVVKFEGDLERALANCRAQGARITHIDRYGGESRKRPNHFLPGFIFPR